MSKKRARKTKPGPGAQVLSGGKAGLPERYWTACELALHGKIDEARVAYAELEQATDPRLAALVANDLAVLAAIGGRMEEAATGWDRALEVDATCLPGRLNRDLTAAELAASVAELILAEMEGARVNKMKLDIIEKEEKLIAEVCRQILIASSWSVLLHRQFV